MTNREALILALQGEHPADEGGATEESIIFQNICCPYRYNNPLCECKGNDKLVSDYWTCIRCKEKWLNSEVEE